jgi:hypothetical protein
MTSSIDNNSETFEFKHSFHKRGKFLKIDRNRSRSPISKDEKHKLVREIKKREEKKFRQLHKKRKDHLAKFTSEDDPETKIIEEDIGEFLSNLGDYYTSKFWFEKFDNEVNKYKSRCDYHDSPDASIYDGFANEDRKNDKLKLELALVRRKYYGDEMSKFV